MKMICQKCEWDAPTQTYLYVFICVNPEPGQSVAGEFQYRHAKPQLYQPGSTYTVTFSIK